MGKLTGDVLKVFGYILGFPEYHPAYRFSLVFFYICLSRDSEEEKGLG